ncbi:hypothetical protein BC828DRAFT_372178 [Blastocladiella britannica]|nr:hypothetical protein BC828DRAFT_372178 [Blastocladiella britannica]
MVTTATVPPAATALAVPASLLQGGYSNRLLLSLLSALPNEVDGALSSLLVASAVHDREFNLHAVPGLVDALLRLLVLEIGLVPSSTSTSMAVPTLYPEHLDLFLTEGIHQRIVAAVAAMVDRTPTLSRPLLRRAFVADMDSLMLDEDDEDDPIDRMDLDDDDDDLGRDADDEDGDNNNSEDEDEDDDLFFASGLLPEQAAIRHERAVLVLQILRNFSVSHFNAQTFALTPHFGPVVLLVALRGVGPEGGSSDHALLPVPAARGLALQIIEHVLPHLPIHHDRPPVDPSTPSAAAQSGGSDSLQPAAATAAARSAAGTPIGDIMRTASPSLPPPRSAAAGAATNSDENGESGTAGADPKEAAATISAAPLPSQIGVSASSLIPMLMWLVVSPASDRSATVAAMRTLTRLAPDETSAARLVPYYWPSVTTRLAAYVAAAAVDADLASAALDVLYAWTQHAPALARRVAADVGPRFPTALLAVVRAGVPASPAFASPPDVSGPGGSGSAARIAAVREMEARVDTAVARILGPEWRAPGGVPASVLAVPITATTSDPAAAAVVGPAGATEPLRALGWIVTRLDPAVGAPPPPPSSTGPTAAPLTAPTRFPLEAVHALYEREAMQLSAGSPVPVAPMLPREALAMLIVQIVPGATVQENGTYVAGITVRSVPTTATGLRFGSRMRVGPTTRTDWCLWDGCAAVVPPTVGGGGCGTEAISVHVHETHISNGGDGVCRWAGCGWVIPIALTSTAAVEAAWRAHMATHWTPSSTTPSSTIHQGSNTSSYPHVAIRAALAAELAANPIGAPFTAGLVLRNLVRTVRDQVLDLQQLGVVGLGVNSTANGSSAVVHDDLPLASGLALVRTDVAVMAAMYPRMAKVLAVVADEMGELETAWLESAAGVAE